MSSSAAVEKVLILKSQEGEEFVVKEYVAAQSVTIKNMIEAGCASSAIPVTNLNSKTLAMVLEYLNKHGDSSASKDDKKNFDYEFINKDKDDLFCLIVAANYLNISGLLGLISQAIADKVKDMTVEEVRIYFDIENDFTREEEEEVRKENAWAFD